METVSRKSLEALTAPNVIKIKKNTFKDQEQLGG
jgi:hypothetical protein